MVLGNLITEPQYSIGKAQRSPIYEIIKTPGPIYSHEKGSNIKFYKPPEWKIGTGNRSPLYSNEIYNYFKYPYDKNSDLSQTEQEIIKEVSIEPLSADIIASRLNLEMSDLMIVLTTMELSGLIKQIEGAKYIAC